jgi:hypothetical protein
MARDLSEEIFSRGMALAAETAVSIGKTNSPQRMQVAIWRPDAGGNLQDTKKKMRSEREHREDETQPLLCSQSRRQQVDHRGDEDGDDEQDDTNDKSDPDDPVHNAGV